MTQFLAFSPIFDCLKRKIGTFGTAPDGVNYQLQPGQLKDNT
jgi:hypothetical protein